MNSKPAGPPFDNSPVLQAEKQDRIIWQKRLIKIEVWQSCLNCAEWHSKGTEVCMKFNARPPADIIVHGCVQHEADIPF